MLPGPLSERRFRLTLLAFAALLGLALFAAPTALADVFTPESGGSPNADKIDSLYKIVLYISIIIFLIVEGTLIWALVRYRGRRGGPQPAQIRGNTPLEIGWTVAAAMILVLLTVVTFAFLGDIKNPPESDPGGLASGVEVASVDQPNPPSSERRTLEICVNSQQYLFRYDYDCKDRTKAYTYHELVVPIKTTVVLKIEASDVAHSWWVPKLGGKADAIPGHVNETWFKIPKAGIYRGQCAELCGAGHADMYTAVRAVSPEEYEGFVAGLEDDIKAAGKELAAQRKRREAQEALQ